MLETETVMVGDDNIVALREILSQLWIYCAE